jgi:cell division GTPase FtsZ
VSPAALSETTLKLTDFPYAAPGYGRKVAVVCVGSAGCKIGSQLSRESRLLEHFVYVTCDDHDVANITKGERIIIDVGSEGKTSPFAVRGLAGRNVSEIKNNLADSEIVFIIAGLGGATGSGLAPLIAREANSKGAVTVAILVMPYKFEKPRHFFAGTALKQVRKYASGVVLIDNDELLEQDMPIIDAYALVNQRIAIALNKLLGSAEEHEFSIGLNNVVNFVKTSSFSVLCLGDSLVMSDYKQAVMNAASHFDATVDKREASASLVHLCTDKSIMMKELVTSIGGLSGVLGSGTMQMEYGLSANSSTTSTAIIMAKGFSVTKFDNFDPVDMALKSKGTNLEDDFDQHLAFASPLISDIEGD